MGVNNDAVSKVQSDTNIFYHITAPTHTNQSGISLGNNFGLFFFKTNNASTTEAYFIDYSGSSDMLTAPNFDIINASSSCGGDTLIGVHSAGQSDSVQWFVNHTYFSSSDTLFYPTPSGVYTNYSISLRPFKDGNMSQKNKSVTFNPPAPPQNFSINVDTAHCYGSSMQIQIFPGSPSNVTTTVFDIIYDTTTFYSNHQLLGSSFSLFTPNITHPGDLLIVRKT